MEIEDRPVGQDRAFSRTELIQRLRLDECESAVPGTESKLTMSGCWRTSRFQHVSGGHFEFGVAQFERQLVIRPGDGNFADVQFLGVNNSTVSLFSSFKDNGDRFNPRFSLDSVSTT